MRNIDTLIITRYLLVMGHLVLTITSLLSRDGNVTASLPFDYTNDDYYYKDAELITALSLSIAFICMELLSFASGFTMFSDTCMVYSILAHAFGSLALTFFIIELWQIHYCWYIFSFSVCVPLTLCIIFMIMDFYAYGVKFK